MMVARVLQGPVSYTHLDVYKRQLHSHVINMYMKQNGDIQQPCLTLLFIGMSPNDLPFKSVNTDVFL